MNSVNSNPFIHWNAIQKANVSSPAPANPLSYTRTQPDFVPMNVPGPYRTATLSGATTASIDPQRFAGQITAENGGNWSPTLAGRADPTDHGITQMNPVAEAVITGRAGPGVNYFKAATGHEYDRTNPSDQINGMGVYLKYLRQQGLPAAGVSSPSSTAVQTAYNTGARGYANAQGGRGAAVSRETTYQNLLKSHGAIALD